MLAICSSAQSATTTCTMPAHFLIAPQFRFNGTIHRRSGSVPQEGFITRIYKLTKGAQLRTDRFPLSPGSFDVGRDGAIVFAGEDFSHFQNIYLRTPNGGIHQLTHMAPGALKGHLAPTILFHTRSFDGTDIEAALVNPAQAHGSFPLVLLVHGGPSSRFSAGYYWETAWAQLLASHGYQVLMVNPRGSTGYSEDFVKANRGDWGGGDYKDLLSVLRCGNRARPNRSSSPWHWWLVLWR